MDLSSKEIYCHTSKGPPCRMLLELVDLLAQQGPQGLRVFPTPLKCHLPLDNSSWRPNVLSIPSRYDPDQRKRVLMRNLKPPLQPLADHPSSHWPELGHMHFSQPFLRRSMTSPCSS